jgi:phosphohistidine phosphatase
MLLHLLRHGDAGDPEAWTGPDAVRPLSDKGRKQSKRLGDHLASIAFTADAIITSPKIRAEQTAEIVADRIRAKVTVDDRLAGPFELDTVEAILTDVGDPERAVLVGHDPDFSETLSTLAGPRLVGEAPDGARVRMAITDSSTTAAPSHWIGARRSPRSTAAAATPTIGMR